MKNETTVSYDWVKNETTVRIERLGEKWNNSPKWKIGWKMKQQSETKDWVKNETMEFQKQDLNQGFQVVAPSSNIVKY